MRMTHPSWTRFLHRNIPGLAHAAHGHRAFGVVLLGLFLFYPVLILLRPGMFADAVNSVVLTNLLAIVDPSRHHMLARFELPGQWIAAVALLVVPVTIWHVNRCQVKRRFEAAPQPGHGLIARAMRIFSRSRPAMVGAVAITVLYMVALAAPFTSPYSPTRFQDGTVTQFRPPLSVITGLHLRELPPPEPPAATDPARGGFVHRIFLTAWNANARLAGAAQAPVMLVDSFRVAADSIAVYAGMSCTMLPSTSLATGDANRDAFHQMHLLGTDSYGRDITSRLIHGAQVSLALSLVAVLLATLVGTLIGLAAGYFGRLVDGTLMRFVDMMLAFPSLFLILICIAMFERLELPRIGLIMIIIGLTSWMGVARLVRGEVLSIRERQYILAARALGLGSWRILLRHILPNTLSPVIINTTLRTGGIILLEAALSFLNLGVQPPTPSWGNIVYEGKDYIAHAWWISTIPGLVIAFTVLAFNLIGDGLRDTLDPVETGER